MAEEANDNLAIGRMKKFIVHKVGDLEDEGNYFVLAPERDKAAFEALKTYRDNCEDVELKKDLNTWIKEIGRRMGWEPKS